MRQLDKDSTMCILSSTFICLPVHHSFGLEQEWGTCGPPDTIGQGLVGSAAQQHLEDSQVPHPILQGLSAGHLCHWQRGERGQTCSSLVIM